MPNKYVCNLRAKTIIDFYCFLADLKFVKTISV